MVLWLCVGTLSVPLAGQPEAEPETAPRLVFEGEPLVLPLECWEEDLLRAGLVCQRCHALLPRNGAGRHR